jgi:hypothetical protein
MQQSARMPIGTLVPILEGRLQKKIRHGMLDQQIGDTEEDHVTGVSHEWTALLACTLQDGAPMSLRPPLKAHLIATWVQKINTNGPHRLSLA